MKMFLLITFLALELIVSINGIPACGPNQQYFECGPCEQICDREPQSCTAICRKPGCYCQQGYIRASPCNSSECVLPSNCPGQCGVNEVYNSCGGCDQICNHEPIFCTQDCSRPGCYCKKGYVRAAKGRSDCIPISKCQRNQCGINEEYKCSCEQYCNEPPVDCFRCSFACYCKEGYKRSFRGGICIKASICIRSRQIGSSSTQNAGPGGQDGETSLSQNSGQKQCRVNEVYKYCGGCDQYCDKAVSCTADCRPGCYCQDGYVRSFSGGICIPRSICPPSQGPSSGGKQNAGPGIQGGDSSLTKNSGQQPQQCRVNEVYRFCGCDQYCDNRQVCNSRVCRPGCYCQDGYVRSFSGGICIPPNICQQQQCGVNEVFKECRDCDQYCNEGPVACTAICIPGCSCRKGYKRSFRGGVCVPASICPWFKEKGSSLSQNSGQQKLCYVNEEYKCGCEQYCNKPPIFCYRCTNGCFCKNGYKRSFPGGVCIPISICPFFQGIGLPPTQNTGPQAQGTNLSLPQNGGPARCNSYEVFKQCGCDQVCGKNPVICAQSTKSTQNCRPDCYCKDGLVRADNRKGSKCIKPEQCQGQQKQCYINEEYKCSCEQYCGEPLISCFRCTYDCYCQYGYKRSFPGGVCIPISICPLYQGKGSSSAQITGPQDQGAGTSLTQNRGGQQRCGENEEYIVCGGCDGYCNAGPIACAECLPACYCRKGYVRLSPGGKCVLRSSCPRKCKANEVFKNCGGCDQYCNRGPVSCPAVCSPGCYCKDGYKRSPEGTCVLTSTCEAQQQQCYVNEVFKYCNGCDQYCNEGPVLCRNFICRPGCYCQDGYKRSFRGGICIPISICPRFKNIGSSSTQSKGPKAEDRDSSLTRSRGPRKCKANEVFKNCGGCDQYCNRGPVSCPAVCSPGCYCKDGYKRSPEGTCVLTSTCESQQQCNINEVFKFCGGCDQYCNEKPRICTSLACIPGCYCQNGYKRSFRGGICIPESICPRARLGEDSFVEEDTRTQVQEESFNEENGSQSQVVDESVPEEAGPRNQDVGLYERAETSESFNDGRQVKSSNSGTRSEDIVTYEETDESFSDWNEYESSSSGSRYEDKVTYETEETSENFGEWSEFGSSNSGSFSDDAGSSFVENEGPRAEDDSASYSEDSEANPSFDQGSQGPGYNCRLDEVFDACGVGPECENYCGRGANACAYCKPGCYCKQGTIRAGPSNTTRCIPENQCSTAQKCFANEVYNSCGTACPANCENRNPICTKNCVAGCFCKKGYIRRYADLQTYRYECIPENQCPS